MRKFTRFMLLLLISLVADSKTIISLSSANPTCIIETGCKLKNDAPVIFNAENSLQLARFKY